MTLIADRYLLGETIGTGGMSNVYAADDTLLGRDVAVKILKPELSRDENFRERFRREAQNSARLNHPNIVSVFDTGETIMDGTEVPSIVMERVYGTTIRDNIREYGPLTPEEAAELLIPVCDALQCSHDAGIIHRDIKPANIMVTNTGAVKVMDFGIARALDDTTSAMTQTSAVIGTAQYLSPEQARGKKADTRSDVYALGCVLYEMVTGETPFQGETPFAVAYQHVQDEPEPPSSKISGLSHSEAVNIDSVVLTALAKHPGDRYQSATEMRDDLGRLARGSVTQAARTHVMPAGSNAPTTVTPSPYASAPQTVAPASSTAVKRKMPSETNWAKWLSIVLSVLVIIAASLFGYQFWESSKSGDQQNAQDAMVQVPDVTGKSRNDATAELRNAGFNVDYKDEPNPTVPADHVISINPTAGSQLRKGTNVTLTVSTGREQTDVPDLKSQTPEDAGNALRQAGLTLDQNVQQKNSDNVPKGQIMEQDPSAGARVDKGSAVAITVSLGPETVKIPDLKGLDWKQASDTLTSMGLTPTAEYVDDLAPKDKVLAVGGSGQSVTKKSTVIVRVSNGMLIKMPDVTHKSLDDARAELRKAGWQAPDNKLVVGPPVDTGALLDNGQVAQSDPGPGSNVHRDAAVTVRLWQFNPLAIFGPPPPPPPGR